MRRCSEAIVKYRVVILILSVLLLIPSAWGMLRTRINYDILSYLPPEIDTMKGQDILMEEFDTGAYAFLIVDGMKDKEVARLEARVEAVDHVKKVLWFDDLADLSLPIAVLPEEVQSFFHPGTSTMMFVTMEEGTSADSTMQAITDIRKVAGEQCFLASMSAMVTDIRDMVERELFYYVAIAVVLAALVLSLTLDSFMIPVLFLTSIGMAILYNLGTNVIQGQISFITMALAAVLQLAVTMDYSIFLYSSYQEEMKLLGDKDQAMARAIQLTINSITGSSLTTVAGFLALCAMSFTLGMDLGIVMAKGVVFGVISCVTVLPALLLVFHGVIEKTKHRPLRFNYRPLAVWVVDHHKLLAVLMVILWIPALYGYRNNRVYYKLDTGLPDYLPCIQANARMDEDYDMNTIHLVLYDSHKDTKQVRNMCRQLSRIDGVGGVLCMDNLIGPAMPKEMIPTDALEMLESENRKLMVISSDYAVASDEVNRQIDEIQRVLQTNAPGAMLIGEAPATYDLIQITNHDFTVVNMISIGVIFFLIALVLRSISLPFILVLVIELAIYINLGISYYTGAILAFIAPICISTIQLGSTVDYAILMTNRYKRERSAGRGKREATIISLDTSIQSVITSAIGFFAATIGVGLYSDVDLIGSLCVLMGRGALISLAVVVLILPSMYMIFDGLICRTSLGFTNDKI